MKSSLLFDNGATSLIFVQAVKNGIAAVLTIIAFSALIASSKSTAAALSPSLSLSSSSAWPISRSTETATFVNNNNKRLIYQWRRRYGHGYGHGYGHRYRKIIFEGSTLSSSSFSLTLGMNTNSDDNNIGGNNYFNNNNDNKEKEEQETYTPISEVTEVESRPAPESESELTKTEAQTEIETETEQRTKGEAPAVVYQDLLLSETGTEAHALEVFSKYAAKGLYEGQKYVTTTEAFFQILQSLDIEATEEDAEVVFRYLNSDGDGRLLFNNDFFPWYMAAHEAATEVAESFQSLIVGRRSIDKFDETKVDDDVVYRAVQCAIAAPNGSCTEPWRFICVGSETVAKFAKLNEKLAKQDATENNLYANNAKLYGDWNNIAPGWCVVTTKLRSSSWSPSLSTNSNGDGNYDRNDENYNNNDNDKYISSNTVFNESANNADIFSSVDSADYKSVCCGIQNFMLSMWGEGIGTRWMTGPVQKTKEFADLCGVDLKKELVVGIIWYGYASGGAKYADPKRRKLAVDDVLSHLP